MPIYKYKCQKCGSDFEVYKSKLSEFYWKNVKKKKTEQCPYCKAENIIVTKKIGLKEAIACGKTGGGFG
ncbi:MAG: FmdB family zinc ribbon protein [bacterium]